MRQIGLSDISDIALGASLLGAGGGGDPYIGTLMVLTAIREHGDITLLDPEEIANDALVLPIGMMGAPTVLAEKGIGNTEVETLCRMAEKTYGRKPDALMCTEAGGVNSMMPLCAGARLGIPVVDADGMGRAFPELQMETMTIGGVKASPVALVDEKGNQVTFETVDNRWTEELARACTIRCGGNVCVTMYAMDGATFKKYSVFHTISRCQELGRLIRTIQSAADKDAAFLSGCGGFELFLGKITDVERDTNGAFNLGQVTLDGIGSWTGRQASVTFQNENLSATVDGELCATVPDLICLTDAETCYPVTTDALRYGKRVRMIGIPCHPLWRTTKGLELVGPGYFGIQTDYIPLEERVARRKADV
ncbi:MAG: DUF917 domain-containing protein [Clostridiales bacterium]|nr:DUF917 domain-containing protein [Clostridiales bacterium]